MGLLHWACEGVGSWGIFLNHLYIFIWLFIHQSKFISRSLCGVMEPPKMLHYSFFQSLSVSCQLHNPPDSNYQSLPSGCGAIDRWRSQEAKRPFSALIKEAHGPLATLSVRNRPLQTRDLLAPWSLTSRPQNCEQYISLVYRLPSLRYFVIAIHMTTVVTKYLFRICVWLGYPRVNWSVLRCS